MKLIRGMYILAYLWKNYSNGTSENGYGHWNEKAYNACNQAQAKYREVP